VTGACCIRVRGVVQGVGLRPFVYRLAHQNALAGWVLNAGEGVEIHVEGAQEQLHSFVRELSEQAPAAYYRVSMGGFSLRPTPCASGARLASRISPVTRLPPGDTGRLRAGDKVALGGNTA